MANQAVQFPPNLPAPRDHHHHVHNSNLSVLYKRVIIHAIQELQDYHNRSNIDCIRRKAQTSMETGHEWNETMFLKALKNLVESGEIIKCNPGTGHISTCEISSGMKKKVTSKAQQIIHAQQQLQQLQQYQQLLYAAQQQVQYQLAQPPQVPQLSMSLPGPQSHSTSSILGGSSSSGHVKSHRRHSFDNNFMGTIKKEEKEAAAKRPEHFKDKIIPKKLYDQMFTPIKNPMMD
jgi:hypothetical protein